jgi:hypothetical protein
MLLPMTLYCRVIIPTTVDNPIMTNPVPVILAIQIPPFGVPEFYHS